MKPPVLERWVPLIEDALNQALPPTTTEPVRLHEAMRYSVMAGGKRLRPILAVCAYAACGGKDFNAILPAAAALELLHTYSLIHDDLPSMDNDELRRGKPTNHLVFGEAIAILAGDALQTLGALLLSREPAGSAWTSRRNRACSDIFSALGSTGMAGGQAMDMEATGASNKITAEALTTIHRLKTGRLLEASLLAGATWAGAPSRERRALTVYGRALGLAFQIVDDLLDETASREELGKTPGKDIAQGKTTFPVLWGIEESGREADRLLTEALEATRVFGRPGDELRQIALYVVNRKK